LDMVLAGLEGSVPRLFICLVGKPRHCSACPGFTIGSSGVTLPTTSAGTTDSRISRRCGCRLNHLLAGGRRNTKEMKLHLPKPDLQYEDIVHWNMDVWDIRVRIPQPICSSTDEPSRILGLCWVRVHDFRGIWHASR
jgi:hypothetical protein